MSQNSPAGQNYDFAGEWLTVDASQGIFDTLTWTIKVTGDHLSLKELSNRRQPAEGTIDSGDNRKAQIFFPGDREYSVELISNGNIIEMDGDPNNHWFRKDSQEATDNVYDMTLQALLAKLETSNSQQERLQAAEDLKTKIKTEGLYLKNPQFRDRILGALSRSLINEYNEEVRKQVKSLSDDINNKINEGKREYKDRLNSPDRSTQEDAIKQLLEVPEAWGPRTVVEAWVGWIASGDLSKGDLIESATERMRETPQAVLPLVNQLSRKLELDQALEEQILKDNKRPEHEKGDSQSEDKVTEWVTSLKDRSDEFITLNNRAVEKKWNQEMLLGEATKLLLRLELADRQQRVYQRVAKQLADMSDARFFKDKEKYQSVKDDLIKYAVPILAQRLPKEADVDLRENIARTLGNIGGPEAPQAIDALVLAVVGDERERDARQQLLATYYLDPSKARSEEAASILRSAVADARKTLTLLQNLNIAIFLVGLAILGVGLFVALFNSDTATRLVGGVAGGGGLIGVIVQLVRDPLDRIQNAMANLVQIETAFTSFIWELNLNGTFIQSQYVRAGVLTEEEVAQTVKRIEDAVNLAMNLVAAYTEEGTQRIVTRITAIEPAAGKVDSLITIHGQHLQGDNSQKQAGQGILAINHVPVSTEEVSWEGHQVKFKLPKIQNANDSTIWISLFVDGMETNALPFHLVNS